MTQLTTSREAQIKRRMKSINVSHRAFFIKNETNLRLCHLEQGRYKYIVIPYCDSDAMITAAEILKQCGIVDGYQAIELSKNQFYVTLIQYKFRKHVDSTGRVLNVSERKAIEWNELSLTRDDVKEFIARFEIYNTEIPVTPRTPCIRLTGPQKQIQLLNAA